MPLFRKRPIVVEAIQVMPANWSLLHQTFIPNTRTPLVLVSHTAPGSDDPTPSYAEVSTLEGTMRADMGDWIVRGVHGELYPVKDNIFVATYEPAE